MATIGSLALSVTARTSKFRKDMSRASRVVNRFGEGIGRISKRVAGFGLLAGGAAAGALSLVVKRELEAIDATAKLSDRIGIGTEALIGLRHAADQTGAGAGKLDAGLQVLSKRLGEVAAKGTGSAKKGLDQLGLSATKLIAMPLPQQVATIADALQNLETQSEKNAAVAALFSRGNQELVNTLQGGAEALRSEMREAEMLGLTFSRIDASKVEIANDALDSAGKLLKGLAATLTIELAPVLAATAERFVQWGSAGSNASNAVAAAVRGAAVAISRVADLQRYLREGMLAWKAGALQATSAVSRAMGHVLKQSRKLVQSLLNTLSTLTFGKIDLDLSRVGESQFVGFAEGLEQEAGKAAKALQDLEKTPLPSEGVKAEFDAIGKRAEELQRKAEKAADAMKPLLATGPLKSIAGSATESIMQKLIGDPKEAAKEATARLEKLKDAAKSIFEETRTPAERFRSELEKLDGLFERGLIGFQTRMRKLSQLSMDLLPKDEDQPGRLGPSPSPSPDLLIRGSAEAQRFVFETQRGIDKGREDTERKQLQTQRKMAKLLRDLVNQNRDSPTFQEVPLGA